MTKQIGIFLNSFQKKLLKEENHKVKDDDVSIVELVAVTDGVIKKMKNCLIGRWSTFKELSANKYNTNIRSGNILLVKREITSTVPIAFLLIVGIGRKKIIKLGYLIHKFKHKITNQ